MKGNTFAVFCISLLFSIQLSHAQPGQAGFTFLKLGVGGRALGMGEAYSALSTDPSATYYNPAGLSFSQSSQILLMHKEWLQDITTEYIAAQSFLGGLAVGVSVNATNINDIELRQQPGPPQGTFNAHNAAFGLSFSYKVDSSFSIGVTGKYLYEKILVDESSGIGVDLGVLYTTPWDVRLGASLSNMGSVNELDVESSKLPTLFRIGAAYIHSLEAIDGTMTFASDLVSSSNEGKSHINVGGELNYHQAFAIRVGYQTSYEARNVTTGLGFRYGLFALDYAFIPSRYDLGSTHTLSLGIEFQ
ncbi:MAG: PorV/PorQ family protein [Ignavibacteriae bacterium]|nr:PorV/PorQ family protein [Ignavibacteria bacterium]MBI3364906.1 PorV/PorQ family protein [Ignavibacteriota bacterium]